MPRPNNRMSFDLIELTMFSMLEILSIEMSSLLAISVLIFNSFSSETLLAQMFTTIYLCENSVEPLPASALSSTENESY